MPDWISHTVALIAFGISIALLEPAGNPRHKSLFFGSACGATTSTRPLSHAPRRIVSSTVSSAMRSHHADGRYELPLSTASSAARDAYVEGCAAKLTMYPGAIEGFDRAIAADPGFAVAHAARAQLLLERGDAAAARASMAAAKSLAAGLSAREASHIAFFGLLAAGEAEAALSALPAHLNAWPRDALVLGTTAFTNGLIGS